MIRDDKARDFVRNFAGQWLTLRKLDNFTPNEGMFPDWNQQIRDYSRTETYYLFLYILRENMSVLRLLDADFSFMNEKPRGSMEFLGSMGTSFRRSLSKGRSDSGS